ncbi:unnamed protein product [Sympodiomycopsis kandeliae]
MRATLRLFNSTAGAALGGQYPRSKTIGFVGLGAMGKEMANNLLTKTFKEDPQASFVICDSDPGAVTRFLTTQQSIHPGRRILPSTSPASLSRLSGTIITMLPSSPQVNDVYLGEDGIMTGLEENSSDTLCIDCTTCDRQTGVDVSTLVRNQSSLNDMIDAPVSGGVSGATAGTLTFLIGSDSKDAFHDAEPHLLKMGSRTIHCGPNGTGLSAKIANNLVLGINMLATSEGMALGILGGISPETMAHILNTSTGKSWSSEINNPVPGALSRTNNKLSPPADRDYNGGFASRLQAKDLKLALQAANQLELQTPMGLLASKIYDTIAGRDDFKDKDFSVAFKALIESSELRKQQQQQQS